ncbi:MAG: acetyl-CoA hydrolase/transferase family protein [Deltaproteobacteria bacterium]|nr:acetyl-CoA hydrolase/transferase family protein [Deltaproteobacteria bacterium]
MPNKPLNYSNWKDEYQRKLVSAEEAVRAVNSGDRVFFSFSRDPSVLCQALADRYKELKDVSINMMMAQTDPGWLDPERADAFNVTVGVFSGPIARDWLAERKVDFLPHTFSMESKIFERPDEARPWDVLMTVVSPPDEHGYMSFGYTLWNKKRLVRTTKTVIAEVDENMIRTGGDNFIHVSEIDYFVKNTQPILLDSGISKAVAEVEDEAMKTKMINILQVVDPIRRMDYIRFMNTITMEALTKAERRLGAGEPTEEEMNLALYVASLVKDGDTLQIGMGRPSANLAALGIFDGKKDLGIHSEVAFRDLSRLIREGVVTGERKTLHPGRVVITGLGGATHDLEFWDNNPVLELYDCNYVNNPKIIADNDNEVAINNAISVDLTGQITAETTFGTRMINGPGGQPDFVIGAALSRGGRSITCLPSTALDGVVSRIVPVLDEGTIVSVPRNYADYVVTEYGIASLMGKTVRERANELIAIAHPDFRDELRKKAGELL